MNLKLYIINLDNFSLLKFREIKNFGIIYKFIIFIKRKKISYIGKIFFYIINNINN